MPDFTPAIEIIGRMPRKQSKEIVLSPTQDDLDKASSHSIESYSDSALAFVERYIADNSFSIDLPVAKNTPCLDSYRVDHGVASLIFYAIDNEDRLDGETDEEITEFTFSFDVWSCNTELAQQSESIFDYESLFDFVAEVDRCIKVLIYMVLSHYLASTTKGNA